jgi:N-acetylmuramoyl-L-alanine amidase
MHLAIRSVLLLVPLLLVSWAPAVEDVSRPAVERISFARAADGTALVLRIHSSDRIPAYSEPRRVGSSQFEVMLFNTDIGSSFRTESTPDPISSVDLAASGSHTRLRINVNGSMAAGASAYRDRDTADLLIALEYDGRRPVATAEPPSTPTAPPRATNSGSAAAERWRLDTIVIDAGHGGRDPGAVAHGVREKDITLAVSRLLGQRIERELGIDVVYTRTDDRFIELRERGRIANEAGGKLFISIHANSAPNRHAHGTETFILGPARTEAARRVMEKENQVVRLESDPGHYERMTEDALIRQTLAQAAFIRKSEELADKIESRFSGSLGRTSRGVKQAGFYVLWNASMPAVLVELGFLTNQQEARFLASSQGQRYLADAIFEAVRAYKEEYDRGLNLVRSD